MLNLIKIQFMKNLLFCLFFAFTINYASAQGCSDAGICAVGNVTETNKKSFKNAVDIGTVFSTGDVDLQYVSPYVSYIRTFGDNFAVTSRLTYSSASGSFGRNSGLGDVFISGNYKFESKNNKQWGAILGFKMPLSNGNQTPSGIALPMDYQSSLGTFDMFVGTNLSLEKWDFNAVVQVPLTQNENTYFNELNASNDFPSTNQFNRKADALFRTTYRFETSNQKFNFKPSVLFIYHLGDDSFTNLAGKSQAIVGSEGLTINMNFATTYNVNDISSIELSLAAPALIRDVRPDGLTRGFVAGVSYKVIF